MSIQLSPDVIPGSIWTGGSQQKFIVTALRSQQGDLWVHYEQMGTGHKYFCLVQAFQQRFTLYTNHNYKGSVWKLSSI